MADELLVQVREYTDAHPDASVAGMFRDLLPDFYERLLGRRPRNLELASSLELFTFNRSTAHLPRFRSVSAFLDPRTRDLCQSAYDQAVAGSDIYTLDRFSEGAIPFDIVIPGKGRGTVCLRDGEVVVDTDDPIRIPCASCPEDLDGLAAIVEDRLGTGVALIGKALTLVLMMASEFVFVLNLEGSAYVPRCRRMVSLMKQSSIGLQFYPILRIGYSTWDALKTTDATFNLPGHLASAFGQGEITAVEFSDSWRSVVDAQERLLDTIKEFSTTEEFVAFLAGYKGESWTDRAQEYRRTSVLARDLSERTVPMKAESIRLKDLSYQLKQEVQQLAVEKGEHFRSTIKPLRDEIWQLQQNSADEAQIHDIEKRIASHEAERADLERRIDEKRSEAVEAQNRSQELKKTVQSMEKSGEVVAARETLKAIEYEAELARAWLVRDAILTSKGLRYTGHRPSAWWFMLVDPELNWFRQVAETAEFQFEEIEAE